MAEIAAYVLFPVLLWWASTAVILYLDGLPRHTHRRSLLAWSVILLLAFAGLAATRSSQTPVAAVVAFACALAIWGWNEVAFLMGGLTGPRRRACGPGCDGWRHVGHAIATVLYHELALLACGAAVLVLVAGQPNDIGAWSFAVLWIMRLSAKLNLFLGVPNTARELLPEHLGYLGSYFEQRPMNGLFPVSVSAATIALVLLVLRAWSGAASSFETAGYGLVATLLALAILEHWLLVLPLPAEALWAWGPGSRQGRSATSSEPSRAASSGSSSSAGAAGGE